MVLLILILAILLLMLTLYTFYKKKITAGELIFWTCIWLVLMYFSIKPKDIDSLGIIFGIPNGGVIGAIVLSILLIFYLIFKILIKIEKTESEITELVGEIGIINNQLKKLKK